jgi:hypothetical protein
MEEAGSIRSGLDPEDSGGRPDVLDAGGTARAIELKGDSDAARAAVGAAMKAELAAGYGAEELLADYDGTIDENTPVRAAGMAA